ncbi:MAG: cation:proton antiporter [Candidatus Lokiarchaeota archaeon]|nr:cation:proton antiporter [Candidatus Lokiarchaeota archaeon]
MELNIFLFLSAIFLLTYLIGMLIEKIHIPWIFSALIIGFILAIYNPFSSITSSSIFDFFSQLGMYFLLFIIGFEIDLKEMKKMGKFIIKSTILTILFATVFGTLLIYFLFKVDLIISIIVSLSFATVGEEILIPILDEFNLTNKPLGQTIIGVGSLDDVIEILSLVFVIILVGSNAPQVDFNIWVIIIALFVLFLLMIGLIKLKKKRKRFKHTGVEALFVFVVFILFLFIGIGVLAEAAALAALFAGIGLRTFLPTERLKVIESEVKTICYGFFAPIFFLMVGVSMDIGSLVMAPLLIILIVLVSMAAKILASYLSGKKRLGKKDSILLGIGLSVKFSTSIVIIAIFFANNLITADLYSVIIASSMIFAFLIPILFATLITKWKKGEEIAKQE